MHINADKFLVYVSYIKVRTFNSGENMSTQSIDRLFVLDLYFIICKYIHPITLIVFVKSKADCYFQKIPYIPV